MEQFLISHDLGTSGDKATLFTTDGKLVRSYTASYSVHFFNGNYAEQDPKTGGTRSARPRRRFSRARTPEGWRPCPSARRCRGVSQWISTGIPFAIP